MMVLIIIALLFTGSRCPRCSRRSPSRRVRNDSHQLALMVKTAMIQCAEQHRNYAIDLNSSTMALHPEGEAAKTDDDTAATDAAASTNPAMVDVTADDELDAANKLLAPDPHKTDAWIDMPQTTWIFQPGRALSGDPRPHDARRFVAGDELQRPHRQRGRRNLLLSMISPSIQRQRQPRQGMVLFEVIIALTIFTLVAFALVMALDSSFGAAENRIDIDGAVRGLNNQMALLHASQVLPGDRDMPDDGSGYLYHVSVDAGTVGRPEKAAPLQNMLRATITATWKSRGETQERSVSELIYQP